MPLRKSRTQFLTAFAAAAVVASVPTSASAASVAAPLSQNLTCTGQVVTSPFAKFGDTASYWLAPGGDFETGAAGWAMTNAKVVAGNENLGVKAGSKSLQLGGSATVVTSEATTPSFCVDPTHPQFKFVIKNNASTAVLATNINFKSSTGVALTVAAKVNTYALGKWTVSASQPLATQIPSVFLGTGTTATITFQVTTATAGATVNIDNVMIDPYRRG